MTGGLLEQPQLLVGGGAQCVQIAIVEDVRAAPGWRPERLGVVARLEEHARQLDLRLGMRGKAFDGPAQDVFGIGPKTRESELRRDINHGFETIGVVFQGLQ